MKKFLLKVLSRKKEILWVVLSVIYLILFNQYWPAIEKKLFFSNQAKDEAMLIEYSQEMGGELVIETIEKCSGGEWEYSGPKGTRRELIEGIYKESNYKKTKERCRDRISKASALDEQTFIECGYGEKVESYFSNNKLTKIKISPFDFGGPGTAQLPSCNTNTLKGLKYKVHYLDELIKLHNFCVSKYGDIRQIVRNGTTPQVQRWNACFSKDALQNNLTLEDAPSFNVWKEETKFNP